jgi:uridine kinase
VAELADEAPRRILIDGRSGSGKTELARAIAADWPEAQLVRMDDLYPGWDGLAAGSALVPSVLTTGRYRVWDWAAERYGQERILDPQRPIIVEGVGALSRASRPLADYAVWVEYPAPERKARALARDGATFEDHWDDWAQQEDAFLHTQRPRMLADAVVRGNDVTNWQTILEPGAVWGER